MSEPNDFIGKLVELKEAAGKVRVIAVVDPLTQWVLQPFHNDLTSFLRKIPQDGTFDQTKPIFSLLKRLRSVKNPFIGCADMSAATDRLPVIFQQEVLKRRFGPEFVLHWKNLLTKRWFVKGIGVPFKYEVGQPMGAKSSWPAMAITHHFIVQLAAWQAGVCKVGNWFNLYALLGDDIAIASKAVYDEYLKIGRALGLEFSLAKSLESPVGALEFAKKFFTKRGDCSPVSIGELLVSRVSFPVMVNWIRKRPQLRVSDVLSLCGYRHRTLSILNGKLSSLPPRVRSLLVAIHSPWGPRPVGSLTAWLGMTAIDHRGSVGHQGPKALDLPNIMIFFIRYLYRLNGKIVYRIYTHSRHLIRSSLSNKVADLVERSMKRSTVRLILSNPDIFKRITSQVIDPL